jgi:hypothetical protein
LGEGLATGISGIDLRGFGGLMNLGGAEVARWFLFGVVGTGAFFFGAEAELEDVLTPLVVGLVPLTVDFLPFDFEVDFCELRLDLSDSISRASFSIISAWLSVSVGEQFFLVRRKVGGTGVKLEVAQALCKGSILRLECVERVQGYETISKEWVNWMK